MANTRISNLTASASNLASTDLAPVVQTVGVGPVKMTGLQLAGGLLGSTTFNGSTVTTSSPVLNLTQTWNAAGVTFTGLKFNAATGSNANSASGSLLLDLQLEGSSQVLITKIGGITSSGNTVTTSGALGASVIQMSSNSSYGFHMASGYTVTWGSGASLNGTIDLTLRRAAAATLQLGAADASASATVTITIATPGVVTWSSHGLSTGTPVIFSTTGALPTGITAGTTYYVIAVDANTFQIATSYANATAVSPTAVATSGSQSGTHTGTRGAVDQMFRVQSASGTSNFPGADFAIQGSRGTGTGAGGSIIFQVAPAGSSGTAQNAYSTALTLNSSGQLVTANGSATTPNFTGATTNTGLYLTGSQIGLSFTGSSIVAVENSSNGIRINGTTVLGWVNGTANSNVPDTILARDAANTLALRNGTNAQTFNIYNTYTDASTNEYFRLIWSSNVCFMQTTQSGTGAARQLTIGPTGNAPLTFRTTNTDRFYFDGANGHFLASADNTYDIGASAANRPRDIYAAGVMNAAGRVQSGYFRITSGTANREVHVYAANTADGILLLLNSAETDFNRIQFGGTTSSFPALKRVSANLQVIAADNTASAGFIVGNQALATSATDGFLYVPTCAGTPTGTPTTQTGTAPIVVDTTNNKLYFYSGGAWRDAGP